MNSRLRVCFMGTPDFAVPALNSLVNLGHQIVAVYTQPPRPSGRGQQLQLSAIHQFAEQQDLPVYYPENFKNTNDQQTFFNHKADLVVVAAYGLILPKILLQSIPLGFINIHASLLPRWRGASPIQSAILAGDKETGITMMRIVPKLDAGDIISQQAIPILANDTAQTLHDRLSQLGANMVSKVIRSFISRSVVFQPQDESKVTYAPKITKQDGSLNWQKPAYQLEREIRAYHPWPGSFLHYGGENIRVTQAEIGPSSLEAAGTILGDGSTIVCGDGQSLRLLKLQRPGRKIQEINDFLRGFPLSAGHVLSHATL